MDLLRRYFLRIIRYKVFFLLRGFEFHSVGIFFPCRAGSSEAYRFDFRTDEDCETAL